MGSKRATGDRPAVELVRTTPVQRLNNLPGSLRRTTRHAFDGPNAILTVAVALEWRHYAEPLLVRQSGVGQYFADFGDGFQWQPEVQRLAGCHSEASGEWPAIPGGLYVLEVHDRLDRLLRSRRTVGADISILAELV